MYADEFGTGEYEGGEDAHLDAAYEDKFADLGYDDPTCGPEDPYEEEFCYDCNCLRDFCECEDYE